MEDNLRPNIPSPSTDPEATAGCRTELTLTNSDSSAITDDTSKETSRHCANAKPGQLKEWTNEKHSLYLNSLEASFVTELQRSMHLRGWLSQDNMWGTYSSEEPPAKTHNSSDQFIVLRDGCWQRINFKRNDPLLENTADSHPNLGSPWIRHFTPSGKRHTVTSLDVQKHVVLCSEETPLRGNSTLSCGSSRGSEQHPESQPCHQDFVGSTTEVSDQNFVDEDQGEKSSCGSRVKRLKTAAADVSSNDQVVPFGKFNTTDVLIVNNASSERELLSEQSQSLVCTKSDVHYFLRGS